MPQLPNYKMIPSIFSTNCLLTFVESHNDLLEYFHEVHVVIAEVLHLDKERNLGAACHTEAGQEGGVDFQMAQRLLCNKFFLLVPFNRIHNRVPNLRVRKIILIISSITNTIMK